MFHELSCAYYPAKYIIAKYCLEVHSFVPWQLHNMFVISCLLFQDYESAKVDEPLDLDENTVQRNIAIDSPSRVPSLDNVRTISTVIAAETYVYVLINTTVSLMRTSYWFPYFIKDYEKLWKL